MATHTPAIKTDCAQCAHKHLTAAYAALTQVTGAGGAVLPADFVLMARFVIVAKEADAGHIGNRDLAVGCLVVAEAYASAERSLEYRNIRLRYLQHGSAVLADPGVRGLMCAASIAAAHIAEALREYPASAPRPDAIADYFDHDGGFNCPDTATLLELLRTEIAEIADAFAIWSPVVQNINAPEPEASREAPGDRT